MAERAKSQEGLTRRELVFTAGAGVAGLAVGGAIGAALGGGDSTEEAGVGEGTNTTPIVVGGAYPLTGVGAGDGVEAKRALELAVEDLNAAGGVHGRKVEAALGDIESDLAPDKIRNQLERLVNEKGASFISMVWCSTTNGEWDPVVRSGVPLMHINAYSGNTKWVKEDTSTRGMVFQADCDELFYGSNLVGVLQRIVDSGKWTPKKKTVAIITSTDPYSVNIAVTFQKGIEEAGWKVVVFDKVTAPQSEWGPQLAKVREAVPDLVVNTDWIATDLAAFTKQFMGSPTPSLVYEQFGPSSPEYLELAGSAANGVLWTTNIGLLPDEMGDAYRERFDSTYPVPMGWSTGGAIYDCVMAWAMAARLAGDGSDFEAVVNEISKINYRGVTGTLRFFPDNHAAIPYPPAVNDPSLGMPMLTLQIQDGKQIYIDPSPYVTGEFILPPQLA